ncbi:LOW QUALITY PROTEIN: hypothetical protein CVT26_015539 [Gymnopilus dilepis]|uniref:Uncharacterized protein n=1 Tax=Gymnopilus dilepis TaxID=231916 RepID=A0A409YD72_9AGAR|nr:LOW QUALITY PROTEIN: hypothetical protein CVT26_015539 [Gymnopilus dilepis]
MAQGGYVADVGNQHTEQREGRMSSTLTSLNRDNGTLLRVEEGPHLKRTRPSMPKSRIWHTARSGLASFAASCVTSSWRHPDWNVWYIGDEGSIAAGSSEAREEGRKSKCKNASPTDATQRAWSHPLNQTVPVRSDVPTPEHVPTTFSSRSHTTIDILPLTFSVAAPSIISEGQQRTPRIHSIICISLRFPRSLAPRLFVVLSLIRTPLGLRFLSAGENQPPTSSFLSTSCISISIMATPSSRRFGRAALTPRRRVYWKLAKQEENLVMAAYHGELLYYSTCYVSGLYSGILLCCVIFRLS